MGRVVRMEVGDDGVALLTLNKPPVNSLDNAGPNSRKSFLHLSFLVLTEELCNVAPSLGIASWPGNCKC